MKIIFRNISFRFWRTSSLILLMALAVEGIAQQEWGYTQYLFNIYDINSAYAGNHNGLSVAARYRSQWLGMEGAPVTQQVSLHSPVMKSKMGIGLRMMNESIGARNQQLIKGSGAYKLQLSGMTLSFGIAAGVIRQATDRTKITAADTQDAQLAVFGNTTIVPVVDAAIFINSNRFYAGIESTRINRTSFHQDNGALSRLYANFNLTAGYMHRVMSDNMLQISGLLKYSEGQLWQAELNLLYLIRNKIWFGGGYKFKTGYQVISCINITNHFRIGLSYDVASGELMSTNDGSAEVFLGYTFNNRSPKSIRYF